MNNLFLGYAAHCQKIEDFIDALAVSNNPNELKSQHLAARRVGLNLNSLTSDEIDYIETEVANRYNKFNKKI